MNLNNGSLLGEIGLASDFGDSEEVDVWTLCLGIVSHHVPGYSLGPGLVPNGYYPKQKQDGFLF